MSLDKNIKAFLFCGLSVYTIADKKINIKPSVDIPGHIFNEQ